MITIKNNNNFEISEATEKYNVSRTLIQSINYETAKIKCNINH